MGRVILDFFEIQRRLLLLLWGKSIPNMRSRPSNDISDGENHFAGLYDEIEISSLQFLLKMKELILLLVKIIDDVKKI